MTAICAGQMTRTCPLRRKYARAASEPAAASTASILRK
jgi:hypothetical protein